MASIRRRRRQLDRTPRAFVRPSVRPSVRPLAASLLSPTPPTDSNDPPSLRRCRRRRRRGRTCSVRSYAAFKCMACNERASERERERTTTTAGWPSSAARPAELRISPCPILYLTNTNQHNVCSPFSMDAAWVFLAPTLSVRVRPSPSRRGV